MVIRYITNQRQGVEETKTRINIMAIVQLQLSNHQYLVQAAKTIALTNPNQRARVRGG